MKKAMDRKRKKGGPRRLGLPVSIPTLSLLAALLLLPSSCLAFGGDFFSQWTGSFDYWNSVLSNYNFDGNWLDYTRVNSWDPGEGDYRSKVDVLSLEEVESLEKNVTMNLKAFLDEVPNNTLSNITDSFPLLVGNSSSGPIFTNESFFQSIQGCAMMFENSSRNSSDEYTLSLENLSDSFGPLEILQDFAVCVSDLIDQGPYSNLTDVVDIMFNSLSQGFNQIFESLESVIEDRLTNTTSNRSSNSSAETEAAAEKDRDLLREIQMLDYIWSEDVFGNKVLDTVKPESQNNSESIDRELPGNTTANEDLSGDYISESATLEAFSQNGESKEDSDGYLNTSKEANGSASQGGKKGINVGALAAAVGGSLFIGIIAAIGIAYAVRSRKREKLQRSFSSLPSFANSEAAFQQNTSSMTAASDGSSGFGLNSNSFSMHRSRSLQGGSLVSEWSPVRQGLNLEINSADVKLHEVIGRGAFGVVHKGYWRGREVAVKMLSLAYGNDEKLLKTFKKEVDVLAKLQHQNIVHLFGACIDPPNVFLVEEFMNYGSLHDALYKHKIRLSTAKVLSIALDVASALSYLHPRVVHCDLKPHNILLDEDGHAKVADFGIAKFKKGTYVNNSAAATNGTPAYMAPELFSAGHVSEKCDVYSLGIVIWECLALEEPWKQMEFPIQVVMAVAVETKRPEIPSHCPKSLERLIRKCWQEDAHRRPSCAEIVKECHFLLEELDETSS